MSSGNEPRSLFSEIWGKIVAAEEEAATASYLSFSFFLRETVSVGPTNCLRVCQINTDQTTFTSRPKTRVYVIGFKNCEVISLPKKNKRGQFVLQPKHEVQNYTFSLVFIFIFWLIKKVIKIVNGVPL